MTAKIVTLDAHALRGFVKCSKCFRMLTGSASKGRNRYYHYYHCSSSCGYRQKADDVNIAFIENLRDYIVNEQTAPLFKQVILDVYKKETSDGREEKSHAIKQINLLNTTLSKARELLLNGDIDAVDYKLIKSDTEQQIRFF